MKNLSILAIVALALVACGKKETPAPAAARGTVLGNVALSSKIQKDWSLESANNCVQAVQLANKTMVVEMTGSACPKSNALVAKPSISLNTTDISDSLELDVRKNSQSAFIVSKGNNAVGILMYQKEKGYVLAQLCNEDVVKMNQYCTVESKDKKVVSIQKDVNEVAKLKADKSLSKLQIASFIADVTRVEVASDRLEKALSEAEEAHIRIQEETEQSHAKAQAEKDAVIAGHAKSIETLTAEKRVLTNTEEGLKAQLIAKDQKAADAKIASDKQIQELTKKAADAAKKAELATKEAEEANKKAKEALKKAEEATKKK